MSSNVIPTLPFIGAVRILILVIKLFQLSFPIFTKLFLLNTNLFQPLFTLLHCLLYKNLFQSLSDVKYIITKLVLVPFSTYNQTAKFFKAEKLVFIVLSI